MEGDSINSSMEEMYLVSGSSTEGVWEVQVPAQTSGTTVEWYVSATDANGTVSVTDLNQYEIFQATDDILIMYSDDAVA